jgi:hypothetical protein
MNQLTKSRFGDNIYCVFCGRMTPDQNIIVSKRSKVNTQLFIDIMTWFVQESSHPGFKDIPIPEKCLQPLLTEDEETKNNTDYAFNKNVETLNESGTYYFSSAHDPSEGMAVYGSCEKNSLAMFQRSAPTLLAYGGTYANVTDVPIEIILPFAFPFGFGGPKMNQRVKVSL